ncbi:MAG: LysM-like peptidoglycan-binding domain-containing protein, partial [Pseudomonadota bacterium]|nr:LysM-like peptidoglycan-binding domain-containing protein [Pseudomonadota bacterium]
MTQNYKPTLAPSHPSSRWLKWFIAGLGVPLILVVFILPDAVPGRSNRSETALITTPLALPAANPGDPEAAQKSMQALLTKAEPTGELTSLTVRRGDSLDRMFRRNRWSIRDLAALMQPDLSRRHLHLLKPGDEIVIRHHNGRILSLSREIDFANSLRVYRSGDAYLAETVIHEIVPRQIVAGGDISSSLFKAAAKAGISDQSIMNLAGIFAWDIDFVLDIREGD